MMRYREKSRFFEKFWILNKKEIWTKPILNKNIFLHKKSISKQNKKNNEILLFMKLQSLTRIASAPAPSDQWHTSNPSQAPQIVTDILTPWSHSNNIPLSTPPNHQKSAITNASQANRSHIQYHLSSIFPEEQVLTVMQMYPDETNPQNICAAILNMYPRA